jgi:hypothetical protein
VGFDPDKLRECMDEAGYSPNVRPNQILGPMYERIQRRMDYLGISTDALLLKHVEKLNCKHPAHPGQDDNSNQLRALDMFYKILQAYAPTKLEVDKTEKHVDVSIEAVIQAEKISGEKILDAEFEVVEDDDGTDLEGPI